MNKLQSAEEFEREWGDCGTHHRAVAAIKARDQAVLQVAADAAMEALGNDVYETVIDGDVRNAILHALDPPMSERERLAEPLDTVGMLWQLKGEIADLRERFCVHLHYVQSFQSTGPPIELATEKPENTRERLGRAVRKGFHDNINASEEWKYLHADVQEQYCKVGQAVLAERAKIQEEQDG